MEEEKWLPVVGYEGLYEVSNLGRVRSADRLKRTAHSPYVLPGRVLKQHTDRKGYKRITLHLKSDGPGRRWGKGFFVHRLVLMAHLRLPTADETDANHKDFNVANNCVSNLEWVTHQGNMVYSSVRGRLCGAVSRGGRTKLTAEQVAGIRFAGASRKVPQHEIARDFGVKQQTISKILNGHRWTFGDAKGVPIVDLGVRVRTPLWTRLSAESVGYIKSVGYTKSLAELGKMFGVSRSCIQAIRSGTTWRDITPPTT